MRTMILAEDLCARFPGMIHPLRSAGVVDASRLVVPSLHHELDGALQDFHHPQACLVISEVATLFVVEPQRVQRVHPVITMVGPDSTVGYMSSSALAKSIAQACRVQDYLKPSHHVQVAWWSSLDPPQGVVLSEHAKNRWCVADPVHLDASTRTLTPLALAKELVQAMNAG